jgi:hypothetical protein
LFSFTRTPLTIALHRWLNGDCALIIVAGSDTTTTTLTHAFYHLARSPQVFSKLRKELDAFYKPSTDSEFRLLQEAPYLNGVINETLRLHPPVPSGVLRVTPPEGITINSTYIPGGVTISVPNYSLGRREFFPFFTFSFYLRRGYSLGVVGALTEGSGVVLRKCRGVHPRALVLKPRTNPR